MWSYEHGVRTAAAPGAIWRLWADVANWGAWNADIATVEIDGPFAVGGAITMVSRAGDTIALRIADLVEGEHFTDEARLGDIVVRTIHRMERTGDHDTRVVYRMEITGPGADTVGPELGPAITADFPDTIAALVRLAEG